MCLERGQERRDYNAMMGARQWGVGSRKSSPSAPSEAVQLPAASSESCIQAVQTEHPLISSSCCTFRGNSTKEVATDLRSLQQLAEARSPKLPFGLHHAGTRTSGRQAVAPYPGSDSTECRGPALPFCTCPIKAPRIHVFSAPFFQACCFPLPSFFNTCLFGYDSTI